MSAWWNGLTALQHVLYCIAVPSTILMLLQTVLMLIGLGGHGDLSGHGPIGGDVGHDIPHDAIALGHSTVGHAGSIPGAHASTAAATHDAKAGSATEASDTVSFRLFTFQSILVFLVVFGWTAIAMAENRLIPGVVIIFVSLLAGAAGLFLTAWLFYSLLKLQNSGNIRLSNAVGLEGEVYIPIPPDGKGQGKVNLLLQGRWLECDAVTHGLEALKTRQPVKVMGVQGGSVLIVEAIHSEK